MLSMASIWTSSGDNDAKLREIKRIEELSLKKLGSLIASCIVKLLHLAEVTVENISKLLRSGSNVHSYQHMQAVAVCLHAVLDNAQIETQVSVRLLIPLNKHRLIILTKLFYFCRELAVCVCSRIHPRSLRS
jgi:hypothetical protein